MIAQYLKDYGELISITLIPFIIWGMGTYFQDRKEKREVQMALFLDLMRTRKYMPPSRIWVDALNQIDVVFQKDKKVRAAWRSYFDSLHPKSQHLDNQGAFQLDLLSEMANSLGYKDLKQTEIDRFYSPVAHGNEKTRQDIFYDEYLRVLSRSKSLSEAFSDEEFQLHLQELRDIHNME
jgi:hypothetical protein